MLRLAEHKRLSLQGQFDLLRFLSDPARQSACRSSITAQAGSLLSRPLISSVAAVMPNPLCACPIPNVSRLASQAR